MKLQTEEDQFNPQLNQLRRKQQKQEQKIKKKFERIQREQEAETYNFDIDFWQNDTSVNYSNTTNTNMTNNTNITNITNNNFLWIEK